MNLQDEAVVGAEHWTPVAGESIRGLVVRLPQPDTGYGRSLILAAGGILRRLDAGAKTGHAVLARELERQHVRPGDAVKITYQGWRTTQDGADRYRLYVLSVGAKAYR